METNNSQSDIIAPKEPNPVHAPRSAKGERRSLDNFSWLNRYCWFMVPMIAGAFALACWNVVDRLNEDGIRDAGTPKVEWVRAIGAFPKTEEPETVQSTTITTEYKNESNTPYNTKREEKSVEDKSKKISFQREFDFVTNFRSFAAGSRWFMFGWIYVLICFYCCGLSITIFCRTTKGSNLVGRMVVGVLLIACAAFVTLQCPLRGIFGDFDWFFEETIVTHRLDIHIIDIHYNYETLTLFSGLMLNIAFGMVCIPHRENSIDDQDRDTRALYLARRTANLQEILAAASVLLTVAIIHLGLLYQWALACLYPTGNSIYDSIKEYASSLMMVRGVFYTVLLMASYLSTLSVLRYRAHRLVPPETARLPEQTTWLTERGLTFSTSESITRIIALFAPLLAGSLTDILSKAVSK